MRWLITGGCGFIGRNLIARLKAEGNHAIRILDDVSVGSRADLAMVTEFEEVAADAATTPVAHGPVQLIVGDVRDGDLAERICVGMDVIVHLAANTGVQPSIDDPAHDCSVNVTGTFNYLDAVRRTRVGRFVFASSGAPLGTVSPPIHEEMPAHPISPYGASKLAGEAYCSCFYHSFGVDAVALRFGNVYGPYSGRKSSVVAKFIKLAMEGNPWEVYGDGQQTRDFVYVDDLIRAIVLAATVEGIGGEVFQIATNSETTVADLAERLRLVLKATGMPDVAVHHSERRAGDMPRNFSDITKARNRLGWQPRTDLDEGLRRTVEWFVRDTGRAG